MTPAYRKAFGDQKLEKVIEILQEDDVIWAPEPEPEPEPEPDPWPSPWPSRSEDERLDDPRHGQAKDINR